MSLRGTRAAATAKKIAGWVLAAGLFITAASMLAAEPPLPAPANPLPPPAKPGSSVGAAGEMIGFSRVDESGTQTITLVHTGKSWMSVYHIDRSGAIRLTSSRPIDADFSLQLNATSPLPAEIRQMTGAAR